MTTLDRRSFLKVLGAAAAFGGAWAGSGAAQARLNVSPVSILILDFSGGWNVHASFAARAHPAVNPYGVYQGNADMGVMKLSNLLFRERDTVINRSSEAWGATIPGIEDAAKDFSIIGAMRHSRKFTVDDHVQTARFAGTGYLDRLDTPGLGTIIGRYAPQDTLAPPAVTVNLGLASFMMGAAPGAWLPYAPLAISHATLPVGDEPGYGSASSSAISKLALAGGHLEAALDGPMRDRRQELARLKIDRMSSYKEALRRYRGFFLDKAIHTSDDANATARYEAGILGKASPTNAQLTQAFGGSGYADEAALALAIRCIEGGSRFVSVACGLGARHDTHESEEDSASLYVHDAQLLAGVSYVLKKIGLASKVLVVGLSEMARSSYAGTCFNAAGGTDHGPVGLVTPKGYHGSFRQSILLAHGPIKAGREAFPAEPEYGDPVGDVCMTAELLALLAECAGVEREDHPWSESPDGGPISAEALSKVLIA